MEEAPLPSREELERVWAWVLDAGSTDGTPDVVRSLGGTVISTDWPGFADQRRRSLGVGDAPFQLFLDADERLSPEGVRAVQRVLDEPGAARYVLLADPAETPAAPLLARLLLEPSPALRAFRDRAGFDRLTLAELLRP